MLRLISKERWSKDCLEVRYNISLRNIAKFIWNIFFENLTKILENYKNQIKNLKK